MGRKLVYCVFTAGNSLQYYKNRDRCLLHPHSELLVRKTCLQKMCNQIEKYTDCNLMWKTKLPELPGRVSWGATLKQAQVLTNFTSGCWLLFYFFVFSMYFRVYIYNSQFKINGYTKQKTFQCTAHWKALCFLFYLSLYPVFFGNQSSLHPSRSSRWVILGEWTLTNQKC